MGVRTLHVRVFMNACEYVHVCIVFVHVYTHVPAFVRARVRAKDSQSMAGMPCDVSML